MTPTPYEIAKLAVKLSEDDPAAHLADAYDLLIQADRLIKARLADEERKAAEIKRREENRVGRALIDDLLDTPITFDEILKEKLLPKAVGGKAAGPAITTEKGLVKSLTNFFANRVPTPSPLPEPTSPEERKEASQYWLAKIISESEIPRHLFDKFKQWRSELSKNKPAPDSPTLQNKTVKGKSSVRDGN